MPKQRLALLIILGAYLSLALLYTFSTPLYEASDELWHYPMIQYMATHGLQLPPQDPANPGAWRQEGSQPPLYYMLSAVLTSWIDTTDLNTIRRVNPHADIGIVPPDGNINMMTHSHAVNPFVGTALATYIVRMFSILLGALTVFVTYCTALELFPEHPELALGASAINAFLPMFLFISASVNNDNLSNLLANGLVLLLIRLVKRDTLPHWWDYFWIGMVTGTGILAKLNIGFLIPVVGLVLLIISLRLRNWRPFIYGSLISGVLTILIAGWWYWHNFQLYGDPSGLNRFLDMVGRRPVPADLATIWAERDSFMQAFWGFFGGMNVPMSSLLYQILNGVAIVGMIGALAYLFQQMATRPLFNKRWFGWMLTLLWIVISLVSYGRWTSETIASQGRLIFGALSAISIWLTWGLVWYLPHSMRPWVVAGLTISLGIIAVAQPFLTIAPVYALPIQTVSSETGHAFYEPNGTGIVALSQVVLLTKTVTPQQYVDINAHITIIEPLTADWSLFVHLEDENGVIVAQRDVYPGQGLFATSDLPQGHTWNNRLAVFVPTNAYTPLKLTVNIGWYNLKTGERLILDTGETSLSIGQIQLASQPSPDGLPNPLGTNFGNRIELVGYEMSDISPNRGDTIHLTLYWKALQKIDQDYVVFANILDPKTTTKYASSNAMPANWTRPTTTWQMGEIITDDHPLTVASDAPEGIYEIELGLYIQNDSGQFLRLPVIGTNDNYVYLTRVRILEVHP